MTTTRSERSRRIGGAAIAGVLLAVGIVYLVMTLSRGGDPIVRLYPLACAGILLALVVVDLAGTVFRRGRPSGAVSDGAGASPADAAGEVAAEAAEAEAGTGVADLAAEDDAPTRWSVFLPLLLGTIVFAWLALTVDYLLATATYVFGAVWWLDRRRFSWWKTLILAVAAALVVHVLFVMVLHLRLPSVIPGL